MGLKVTRGFSHVCLLFRGEGQPPSLRMMSRGVSSSWQGLRAPEQCSQARSVGYCVLHSSGFLIYLDPF